MIILKSMPCSTYPASPDVGTVSKFCNTESRGCSSPRFASITCFFTAKKTSSQSSRSTSRSSNLCRSYTLCLCAIHVYTFPLILLYQNLARLQIHRFEYADPVHPQGGTISSLVLTHRLVPVAKIRFSNLLSRQHLLRPISMHTNYLAVNTFW
jgi:hypothetical protein